MKKINIFPKDWLVVHPYRQSTPVDSYYAGIANRIHTFMEQTELINSFTPEEAKQVCIRMAAYFEDVISELGIWRAFITTYKEMYGKYLPFYTTDDHYYDDEVNFEDVRFLLWHFTQQYHGYRKGTFVSPDNPVNELTARLIYQLFCDEWTTAPENSRMKEIFSDKMRFNNADSFENFLGWFHFAMYLQVDAGRELSDDLNEFWKGREVGQEERNNDFNTAIKNQSYTKPTPFLALTSAEWLARIMPANHPDAELFKKGAAYSRELITDEPTPENQADREKFDKAAEGKLLVYFKDREEAETFLTEKVGLTLPGGHLPEKLDGHRIAMYATDLGGIEMILENVNCIKDENNPFYDEKAAAANALGFFIVSHCRIGLLKEMEKRGMLADAQAKSLTSPERSKAIVHENWEFLVKYFIREW